MMRHLDELDALAAALDASFRERDGARPGRVGDFVEASRDIQLVEQLFPRSVVAFCAYHHPEAIHRSENWDRVLGPLDVARHGGFHAAHYAKVDPADAPALLPMFRRMRDHFVRLPASTPAAELRYRFVYRYRKDEGTTILLCDEKVAIARPNGALNLSIFHDVTADAPRAPRLTGWHVGATELRKVLDFAPDGAEELSPRELEIAELVATGLSTKRIAAQLGLSANTVRNHRSNILRKAGAENAARLGAVMR